MRWIAAALVAGLLGSPASAEIEKFAVPGEQGLCFYWWPRLPALSGWHHERQQSFDISANALAPDGSTFADAETVIYAKAIYKPREPDTKSVEQLIENDKKEFATHSPNVAAREVSALTTADGRKLRSLTFFPTGAGNWERVQPAAVPDE